jgi:hypothetical protein
MGEDSKALSPKSFEKLGPRSQGNPPKRTNLGKDNSGLRIQLLPASGLLLTETILTLVYLIVKMNAVKENY